MKKKTNQPKRGEKRPAKPRNTVAQRKLIVFASLVGVLGLTSILLRAMAGNPMVPDAAATFYAYGSADSLDAIFSTQVPASPGHWQYIYIHQSKTEAGNSMTLGKADGLNDHFLIGNGAGCADGELQIGQRWNRQQPAVAPVESKALDGACISICLVGDLDGRPPTPVQLGRLGQLVQTLQARYRIPANHIGWLSDQPASPAGIGKYFPATVFRDQLLAWPAAIH